MHKILNGKLCANIIQNQLKDIVEHIGMDVKLDVLLIGDSPASLSYVTGKKKAAEKVGISGTIHQYPELKLEQLIAKLQQIQSSCNGILVQLPLPDELPVEQVIAKIQAEKDVDGFTIESQGALFSNRTDSLKPCTPMGILALMKAYGIETSAKNICVIGRSSIVGNPISHLLAQKPKADFNLGLGDATVLHCNSRTPNLKKLCQTAEIIITAAGSPSLITEDMVQAGATVIDVGICRVEDPSKKRGYRLAGDVDFANVAPKCAWITPVPGGIGPMTITMLLYNTIQAACRQKSQAMPPLDWQKIQNELQQAEQETER